MNEIVYLYLILCVFLGAFRVCECEYELGEGEEVENGTNRFWDLNINVTHHTKVKRFYCDVSSKSLDVSEAYTLVNGFNGWTFPRQDVNLTLKYPLDNEHSIYLITSLEVTLYVDDAKTTGYVTRGGITADNISLTFMAQNVTVLAYDFQLRGFPKSNTQVQTIIKELPTLCAIRLP